MRRRVIVHGRVQGVGFRYALRRAADTREVAGWARNRTDGTVEAVFDGEPAAVESLLQICRDGPPGARVDEIEITAASSEPLTGFAIR